MKRHESLVMLSQEHHFGLLFCWKIRQGIKKQVPAERMQGYVKYFWDNHLHRHFKDEEALMIDILPDSLVEKMFVEHNDIRQLVEAVVCTHAPVPDQLGSLAEDLDNHIRFEERFLFPHLEKALSEDMLIEMGKRLQEAHPASEKDTYQDEFWISY